MTIELANFILGAWKLWQNADQSRAEWNDTGSGEIEMLCVDAGRNLGFTRVVARRTAEKRWWG